MIAMPLRFLAAVGLALTGAVVAAATPEERAALWLRDIEAMADDATEGRLTGAAGYLRAAEYVEKRFREIGLEPMGEGGTFRQEVAFEQQVVDAAASAARLTVGGEAIPLTIGRDLIVSAGGAPRPAQIEAPLVFVGYGLSLPDRGYDDFAGLDLKGKIAVVISGGPAHLPGTEKAANRNRRAALLARAGAVGVITVTTPRQVEIPWPRQMLLSGQPGMYLADRTLRETPDGFYSAALDNALAERLFAGSGHTFAELAALADASGEVPRFALPARFAASTVAHKSPLTSPNLVARLEGSDPTLKAEHVVLSAHLDGLGVGEPIEGDRIYNGAMDDASGVAIVLDIAAQLKAGPRPKRSVLLVIVTAEEKGLLGSHYFARRPTVPQGSLVADLNFDMPLPLWPLKTVLVQGTAESTLGVDAQAAAEAHGLRLVPDPLPDRNSFVRTDQYSFVKAGIPALAFKFGFERGTPEFEIERQWRATRYHSPSDDIAQPGVLAAEAIKLDDYVATLALRVANAGPRPAWLPESRFNPARN